MGKHPPVPPSPIMPQPRKGPRGQPSPLIGSWAYIIQLRQMAEIAEAHKSRIHASLKVASAESIDKNFEEEILKLALAFLRHSAQT